jgi:thioredoxin-dependent peroxiredoxin
MKPVLIIPIAILLSFVFDTISVSQERKIGDIIPPFSSINDVGEQWNFPSDVKGEFVVFFFYPAAMTGGCTTQACSYRDMQTDFTDNKTQVVGVSGDLPDNLKVFRKAYALNFPLLSDSEGKIARIFGVPTRDGGVVKREVDGKEVVLSRNITTERWTFIVSSKGEILQIEKGASPAGDGQKSKQYIINYKNNQK